MMGAQIQRSVNHEVHKEKKEEWMALNGDIPV